MKAHLSAFALSAILIASVGMAPAFGQILDSIVVTTDKASYADGDTIIVMGEVRDRLSGTPVSVIVTAPNGNLVTVAQVTIGADNKFSTEIAAGGALMRAEGTYTVSVQYGTENRTASTSFEFGGLVPVMPDNGGTDADSQITDTTIQVLDAPDLITYEITGGKLLGVTPDLDTKSLMISIQADDDGSLTLTIPRTVLDAKLKNSDIDDEFFVLVDYEQVDFDETSTTATDRTLIIEFPAGAEEIEIIGTFVIPEFGAVAAMVLAVAIIAIIVVSARSRLSIMPRY